MELMIIDTYCIPFRCGLRLSLSALAQIFFVSTSMTRDDVPTLSACSVEISPMFIEWIPVPVPRVSRQNHRKTIGKP